MQKDLDSFRYMKTVKIIQQYIPIMLPFFVTCSDSRLKIKFNFNVNIDIDQ